MLCLTCVQKLTGSKLSLTHGTKHQIHEKAKLEKKLISTKKS